MSPVSAAPAGSVQALPDAPLTIHGPPKPVPYAATPVVKVHLGKAATGRIVSVYAKPNHRKKVRLARRAVDSRGMLIVKLGQLHVLTTLTAVYAGDTSHARTEVTARVHVRVAFPGT